MEEALNTITYLIRQHIEKDKAIETLRARIAELEKAMADQVEDHK